MTAATATKPEPLTGTARYGQYYWCAKVTKDVAPDLDIYVNADYITTNADGSLAFMRNMPKDEPPQALLLLPAGKWTAAYAASCFDGSAVAVDHWTGEVSRD